MGKEKFLLGAVIAGLAMVTCAQCGEPEAAQEGLRTTRIPGGVVRAVIRAQQGAGSRQVQQASMEKLPFLVYWKNYSRPPGRCKNRTVQRMLCTVVV